MNQEILNTYIKASTSYIGNSNSLHKLGLDSKKLETASTKQILDILNLKDYEIIYTSGNAESFTMLLKNYDNVWTDIKSLQEKSNKQKENIDLVLTKDEKNCFGKYNLIDLDLKKEYNDLNKFDYITIEDEIPFFGVLIKRKNIDLKPLINGGKSTTKYRSGTSATPLIASFSKLIRIKYKKN